MKCVSVCCASLLASGGLIGLSLSLGPTLTPHVKLREIYVALILFDLPISNVTLFSLPIYIITYVFPCLPLKKSE